MLKPNGKANRSASSAQVMEALNTVLRRHVPLKLAGTRLTPDDLWAVLTYAAVHQTTPQTACTELAQAPSGNRLREVLLAALPRREQLQGQLNQALQAQLPRAVRRGARSYCIAGDVTLIPYHGQPAQEASEVVRGPGKAGTTHFHGYATLAIVHDKRRYVLALRFLRAGETMAQVLAWLLDRAQRLKIPVRRLYLDKGFATVQVFRILARRRLSYIVPLALRGKASRLRGLFQGRRSYVTGYTMHSNPHGRQTVQVVVRRRYPKRGAGRRGVKWLAYAVAGLPAGCPLDQVYQLYRQRFGIETSYRQMHHVRARTASRNPSLRLLLVGLALLLVNLYVSLRACLANAPNRLLRWGRGGLTLTRLRLWLSRAIETARGVTLIVQHRPLLALS